MDALDNLPMLHPDYRWMREVVMPLVTLQINSNFDPTVFDGFSQRDKVLMVVCEFDAETMNGGIDQYFWNPSGDHFELCLNAFSQIGAPRAQSYLEQAIAFFPESSPAYDTLERRNQIEVLWKGGIHLNDALQYDVEPDLFVKLRAFYESESVTE